MPSSASKKKTKADRAVSAHHTLSNPAASASSASSPSRLRSPPTTTPRFTTAEGYTGLAASREERRLVVRLLGGRGPESLRHHLQHLRGDGGILLDQPLEGPRRDAKRGHLALGGAGGRARPAVEQRDLSEEVTRSHLSNGPSPHGDVHVSVQDQEEADARVALASQDRALAMRDFLARGRDRLELLGGEFLEDRDARQHLHGVLPGHFALLRKIPSRPNLARGIVSEGPLPYLLPNRSASGRPAGWVLAAGDLFNHQLSDIPVA